MPGPSGERALWKAALAATPACLALERFAEALTEAERRHTESCPRCQAELALWQEFDSSPATAEEGAAVTWIAAELKRRATTEATPWWKKWLFAPVPYRLAGSLAVLVLMAGVALYITRTNSGTGETSGEPVYRSQQVQVIAPVGDLEAAPAQLKWQPVAGSAVYRVEVMEVDRHSLWSTETRDASVTLPAAVRALIVPGKTLLWEVTVRNSTGGAAASSGIQKFRLKSKSKLGGEL
ncbi:MAG: hypothetical protein ABI693_18045 [Bryobacteraceae bacterium]